MLTALMPTRNRPLHCARQLRFLRGNAFSYPIVVLDASDPVDADAVRAACAGVAEYRHFGPEFRMADKLAAAVVDVQTPYVDLIPDDDIVLPHAIEGELAFLNDHPDFVVAHGHFLGFRMHGDDVDISDVIGFTPSITDEAPLLRLYNLFRRYQSFYWGVFRTDIFKSAVTAARAMNVVLFRELTVMSTSILQGKVARLPLVHSLRGTAKSHAALHQSHPLFFAMRDAEDFFRNYAAFRNGIATFIRDKGIATPDGAKLEQVLDMVYATFLGREVDVGMINHTVRMLLGDPIPPIQIAPTESEWREPGEADIIHHATAGDRRYVWRQRVVAAEPRDEISIGPDEMARVERQLDAYR
jgi:glycosyltransferase domain-containing protein